MHNQIVRILTTAYSDLDSAIEAVNDGEIFRYITKPWDMRELRGTLLRAIDYSQIQRERDQLLCEKLSVMRRMAMLDYLRTLAVLIVGLEGRLRNAAQALEAYVNAVIEHQESERISMAAGWEDGWALGIEDSEQLVRHAKDIMKIAATDGQTSVNWAELLKHARSIGLETSDLTRESLPAIDADEAMLRSLFTASRAWLCQPTRSAAPRLSVAQIQTNGESGVQLTFAVAAKSDTDPGTHTFSPASSQRNTDLLIVFLIAHHFGGNVSLTSTQIKVILPTTPNIASATSSDDWIERLFTKLVG